MATTVQSFWQQGMRSFLFFRARPEEQKKTFAGKYSGFMNSYAAKAGLRIFDDILNIKNTKHYFQLKYLSSKHEASILKLRFVLQPFSFLFLLAGEKKYHIIWETLDSEEATYIWHADRTRESLRVALGEIEVILRDIKKNGRQTFLEKENNNFSRVVHDYKDSKKGFIAWKGMLEEKIDIGLFCFCLADAE